MPDPFQPLAIGRLTLPNRFVRSATWEGLADDNGRPTAELTELYLDLVRGGVGLIVTGHAFVLPEGQAGPRQLGLDGDEVIPALTDLVGQVHRAGGLIACQLAHAGGRASAKLIPGPPLAPSVVPEYVVGGSAAMTQDDIDRTVEAYGRAAARCREAGFDAVQIHGAHGYLISQFLSPAFNRRTDEYGGSIDNRMRFLRQAYQSIRRAVGPDYPVLLKLNGQDYLDGGLTVDDSLAAAARLAEDGLDAIEISGGTGSSGKLIPVRIKPDREAYFRDEAARFKARLPIPVISVGGIRSLATARDVLDQGQADAISLSRPLIREPGLINRWQSGDLRPSGCLADNLCFRPLAAKRGLYCETARRQAKQAGQKE